MRKNILLLFISFLFVACAVKTPQTPIFINSAYQTLLPDLPQNAKILPPIIAKNSEFSAQNFNQKSKEELAQSFKNRYFRVWEFTAPNEKPKDAFWGLNAYKNTKSKTYFSPSRHAYSDEFFYAIYDNANTANYGLISAPAITINNTLLRNAPTKEPIFISFKHLGEGYPFDYFSNSALGIGYPLFVSHFSKDLAFAFVQNDAVWGWVDSRDIAILNKSDVESIKNSRFITILNDNTALKSVNNKFILNAKVGTILPFFREDDEKFYGEILTKNGFTHYEISKDNATIWPATLNTQNTQKAIQSMLKEPYGWGGWGGYRDCSLFTKDFLATFGYWLPRNSKAQVNAYKSINLNGLNDATKLKTIKENGVPYRTLLYFPGHIMLYTGITDGKVRAEILGENSSQISSTHDTQNTQTTQNIQARQNGVVSVTHSVWGLKTQNDGRAIIGQTAITTLEVGKDIAQNTLLSRLKAMSIVE